jgi:Transglycosylase SLT domain
LKRKVLVLTAIAAVVVAGQTTAQAERSQSTATLESKARWTALHGGITGSCWGCATSKMQWQSRALVVKQFSRAGSDAVRWSLCVVRRESGFNPGAVNSSSGAAGLFQFYGHPQYDSWKLTHDPVYQVKAAWSLSNGANTRYHWDAHGQTYNC